MALALGLTGLAAFLWSLRTGQYEDMDGAALRVLSDDDLERKLPFRASAGARPSPRPIAVKASLSRQPVPRRPEEAGPVARSPGKVRSVARVDAAFRVHSWRV